MRRLEIGPGDDPLDPSWDTVDVAGNPTYCLEWGKDRLAENIPLVAEVYVSHVLEHVPWNRTVAALRDVHAILIPNGLFECWVPDFAYIVGCYFENRCGDDWRRDNPGDYPMLWTNGRIFAYGPPEQNRHRACFDFEHLSNCLSAAGFIEVRRIPERTRGVSHGPIDLGVTCRKPA